MPLIRRGRNFFLCSILFLPIEFNALFVCLSCFLLPACPPDVGLPRSYQGWGWCAVLQELVRIARPLCNEN